MSVLPHPHIIPTKREVSRLTAPLVYMRLPDPFCLVPLLT